MYTCTFYGSSIFVWTHKIFMSVCMCVWFSMPLQLNWLFVSCIYTCMCILVQLMHVHNTYCFVLPSFTISLSFLLVCYTHNFHVHVYMCIHVHVGVPLICFLFLFLSLFPVVLYARDFSCTLYTLVNLRQIFLACPFPC